MTKAEIKDYLRLYERIENHLINMSYENARYGYLNDFTMKMPEESVDRLVEAVNTKWNLDISRIPGSTAMRLACGIEVIFEYSTYKWRI